MENNSSLLDTLRAPFDDAVDVLKDKKKYRKPAALELETVDIAGTPSPEPEVDLPELRKAQGAHDVELAKPTLMDHLRSGADYVAEKGQQFGDSLSEGVDSIKEDIKANPDFLVGAAPLLMGALMGDIGEGASAGGNALIQRYKDDRDLNRALLSKGQKLDKDGKVVSAKAMTKANVVETYTDDGNTKYTRIEDALGQEVPYQDKFQLESKMKLAQFNDRLKNKSGADFESEQKLRKEHASDPITKDTKGMAMSFNKIQDLANAPQTGANDISMIFAYMKMLDPASVVREGEQATAKNAGAIPDSVRLMYNRLIGGADQLLPPNVRRNFLVEGTRIYKGQTRLQDQVDNRYKGLAKEYKLGPGRVTTGPRVRIKPQKAQKKGPPKGKSKYAVDRYGNPLEWDDATKKYKRVK